MCKFTFSLPETDYYRLVFDTRASEYHPRSRILGSVYVEQSNAVRVALLQHIISTIESEVHKP